MTRGAACRRDRRRGSIPLPAAEAGGCAKLACGDDCSRKPGRYPARDGRGGRRRRGFSNVGQGRGARRIHAGQRRGMRAAAAQGFRIDAASPGRSHRRAAAHGRSHGCAAGVGGRQGKEQGGDRGAAAARREGGRWVLSVGGFLSFRRRVRVGVRRDRTPDSGGRHPAAGWLRGEQRRDAGQRGARGARPAGHAQVCMRQRRGQKAVQFLGSRRREFRRPARQRPAARRARNTAFSSAA